jgi:signal transduction histidine kinase
MARLLVADNSPFYRKLLSDSLEESGHRVRTVADGLEALQALEREDFDAAVLDLVMPRLSGARACRQIKASPATRNLPVVILSGLREDEIDDAEGIGADAFVAKMQAEAMMTHLTATLEELLSGRLEDTHRGFDRMHRREVVSELLEERRSRDAILSSLSEGYLRVSRDGLVLETNPAASRMLCLAEYELVNRNLEEVLPCSRGEIDILLAHSDSPGTTRLQSGGAIIAVARSRQEGEENDSGVVLLLTDVTGVERAEAEKVDLQEQVQNAERLSALGEIVAGVAQELNNPLTGLLGYTELLLKLAPDERSRNRLKKLEHEALRCRRIVENLLCFARKRQAYRRPQSLNNVVTRSLQAVEMAAAKAGVEIRTVLAPDLPQGLFDFGQMEQVLANLLANAMQALDSAPPGRRRIIVRTACQDGQLRLEVEDCGQGIPAALRERVFEPFYTTRRPEGGTGLGLAVTYGIVTEHGGRIIAEDAEPGTRILVELPTSSSAGAGVRLSEHAVSGTASSPKILLVDDEPVVLDLLEDLLSDSGFQITRTDNGAQALELVCEREFDAMLIDLKMPDMDGRRLFKEVCARRPAMASRIVFTTGDLDRPDLRLFLDDTGAVLLRKPFELEQVAGTFQAITSRDTPTA